MIRIRHHYSWLKLQVYLKFSSNYYLQLNICTKSNIYACSTDTYSYQDDRVVTLNGYPLSQSSIQRIVDVDCLNDEVHSIKILILYDAELYITTLHLNIIGVGRKRKPGTDCLCVCLIISNSCRL